MYLLYFLEHLNDFVEITLTFVDDNFFRLLYKASTYRITVNSVKKAKLSNNVASSKLYVEVGLEIFRNLTSLSLSGCSIDFSFFYLPTHSLRFLDLSHNKIIEITNELLKSITRIETLLFSYNEISFVSVDLFTYTPLLTHLDLSHNQITSVSKDTTNLTLKNLEKLELQNNYIFKLSDKVFSLSFFYSTQISRLAMEPIRMLL